MKKDEARRDSEAREATAGDGETLAAVTGLMAERRRFEGWIAALAARRESTPQHVFERVNADYQTRLDAVIEKLTSHADGLRREMESLNERLVELRDEQQRAQDERAEAELRAHVGELSAEEWRDVAAASDSRLADLGANHAEMENEIVRTQELLAATQRPSAPLTPAASAEAVSDVAEAAMHVPYAADGGQASAGSSGRAEPEPPRASEATTASGTATESEAAVESSREPASRQPVQETLQIQERDSMPTVAIPAEPVSPLAADASTTRKPGFDELAFLSSVVDTPSGSVEPPPQDEPDEITRRQTFARRSQEDAIVNLGDSGSIPLVSKIPDQQREMVARPVRADAMVRRDSVSDGAKTLKCSECGAMNYPTEWYCERCGAELASL